MSEISAASILEVEGLHLLERDIVEMQSLFSGVRTAVRAQGTSSDALEALLLECQLTFQAIMEAALHRADAQCISALNSMFVELLGTARVVLNRAGMDCCDSHASSQKEVVNAPSDLDEEGSYLIVRY